MPLDGRQVRSIGGVSVVTGPSRRYESTGIPIARLDLDIRYVYVSQRDGWFRILDVRLGKALFAIRATAKSYSRGAWEFKPVVRSGEYLIVQPEGEVIVLRMRRQP